MLRSSGLILLLAILVSGRANAQSAKEHFDNGAIKFRLKKYENSIEEFTKAIALKTDYTDAYYYRAMAKAMIKDTSALSDFSKTIELDPKNVKAYSFRGILKFRMKNYQESIIDFDKSISMKPDNEEAIFYKGSALMELKKYDDAIAQLDKALLLRPDAVAAYYLRGLSNYLKTDYPAAIKDFDKTAALDSNYSIKLFCFRGDAKMKTGQKETACADLKKSFDAGYKEAGELIKKYCQ